MKEIFNEIIQSIESSKYEWLFFLYFGFFLTVVFLNILAKIAKIILIILRKKLNEN